MSDLFRNHIVGFPTRRLIFLQFISDDDDGDITLRRQRKDLEMRDMDGEPNASAEREPMRPPIDTRAPAPLPQQARDEDEDLYEAPVGYISK